MCVDELGQHWFRQWLGACLGQAFIWTNAGILLIESLGTNISENVLENVVCEMADILSRDRWVNFILTLCVANMSLAIGNITSNQYSYHNKNKTKQNEEWHSL